jgi:hypothetical protein
LTILIALLLVAFISSDATVPFARSSGWTIAYSPGMPARMTKKDGYYYFDFPKGSIFSGKADDHSGVHDRRG